jgi:hypothetical protein
MSIFSASEAMKNFSELIRPSNLFSSADEVELFLHDANPEEINLFIEECVKDEAYEYAAVAKKLL